MNIFFELLYNLGILISIGIIAGDVGKHKKYSSYYQGIIFGVGALIGMLNPLVITKGLIFDGRSIMISLAGAYFGPVSAGISVLLALPLRIYQGGIGMPTGISVIIFSGLIGTGFYYYFQKKNKDFLLSNLYKMALITHIIMIFLLFLLPLTNALIALKTIAFPVLLFYPFVTVLIGKIINNAEDRRKTLKKLKETEKTIKGISNNFQSDLIYQLKIVNNIRTFTFLSDSVKTLYGCTVDEAKNNPNLLYGKLHKDYVNELRKIEDESAKTLKILKTEVKIQNPDGTYRWSLITSHPRKEADGTIFFDGMEFVITDRKKLEEDLIMEKNVSERASKAKSEFLANMSHELRTPMNGIIGLGELLSMSPLTPEQKSFVEDIRVSADNLLVIINDILDISKIESGKIELDNKDFDLDKMLNDILGLFSYNAHKKNLELIYYISQDLTALFNGDSGKIRQIITNLIGNAIKFTDEGYVFVEIKKIRDNLTDIDIEISVSDTGMGIAKKNEKNLFQSFVQGDISYAKKYPGTGLGLAISKKLVEVMGGDLKFETAENKGTKFYFQLNLKKSKKAIKIPAKSNFDFKKLSVLYVDDFELNRRITKKILEEAGITVYLAENGLQALDILKTSFDIKLILLDTNMPQMDGFETAEQIIKKFHSSKKIIFFTSVDIQDKISPMKNLGVLDYIIKPAKRKELLTKIEEIFDEIKFENVNKKTAEKKFSKSKKTIFVVEDNYINLNLTIKMLEKLGDFRIITAANGIEAVEMYKKENPDLIFLDIQMPVMNGFEAFEEIRDIASENQIEMPKVIALSAYAMEKDKEKYFEAGMDDFVAKPFKMEDIKNILEKYL